MNAIKCANCDSTLRKDMDIEYSREITEYFCNPDCAINYYFEHMRSVPFLPYEKSKKELENQNITIIDGKLYGV